MAWAATPRMPSAAHKQHTRDQLAAAIGELLAAGEADGTVRAGIDARDLLMSLGGITMIAAEERQRELATRLLDLLMAGVTSGPWPPGGSRSRRPPRA